MLEIIRVGNDPASVTYANRIIKNFEKNDLEAAVMAFDESVTTEDIIEHILNSSNLVKSIMVQMPLPKHINPVSVSRAIPYEKDIDGINPGSAFRPLTPTGIMNWFDEQSIDICGKRVCVLGRSKIVGHPLADMMIDAGATVTSCNSHTKEVHKYTADAEIVVSAIGKAGVITPMYLSWRPQIWIDVGINPKEGGGICGDVSDAARELIEHRGGYCSPVPGGVGKWTQEALIKRAVWMERYG